MTWTFHKSDPMGGAAGEAYANTLKSPGMRPEYVLAREAIQNSVDARVEPTSKVLVQFRGRSFRGAAKKRFVEAARLTDIEPRREVLELSEPNCLQSLTTSSPLSVLFVEDYNTQGLTGAPHDNGSHFYRLLLSLGDRSKARETKGSGGSYGFGKSVYSSSSSIQTIFAYTRFFDPIARRSRVRLFGCGYYASHEFKKTHYSGRAWLGTKPRQDEEGRVVVDPLEDEKADIAAADLGFARRENDAAGTSILIVDSTMDLRQIISGVEEWWWPRLIEDALDIEAIDSDGSTFVPRPRARRDLRPFIETFDIARGRAEAIKTQQKYTRLNSLGSKQIGTCGLGVVPLEEESPVVPTERLNTVALIRSPLMVVAYKSFSTTAPYVVGSYVAHGDVDEYLKKAEPPAHDKWDAESANLRDATGESRQVVEAVLSRIRRNMKQFQNEAAPPPPPRPKRLTILENALASYFRPQAHGPGPGPNAEFAPLHIEFTESPRPEALPNGKLKIKAAFSVRLDDKTEDDEVHLRLRVGCPVVEDNNQEGDDLKVTLSCKGVEYRESFEEEPIILFRLCKKDRARFRVESEEYDATWTVRLRPEIDREEVKG